MNGEKINCFIDTELINKLESLENKPNKLLELCGSINQNYLSGHFEEVSSSLRTFLNYIPGFYGYKKISSLIQSPEIGVTMKKSIENLNRTLRGAGDYAVHRVAKKQEILLGDEGVKSYKNQIHIIIESIINQVNENDLRGKNLENKVVKKAKNDKSHLGVFEKKILNLNDWYIEILSDKEIMINKSDNMYQIHRYHNTEDFSEPWTQVFPNAKGSARSDLDFIYAGVHIKRFSLIHCDSFRYKVIMPETGIRKEDGYWKGKDLYGGGYIKSYFYWINGSTEFNLTKLLGTDIDSFSRRANIEILDKEENYNYFEI